MTCQFVFGKWITRDTALDVAAAEAICREAHTQREEIAQIPGEMVLNSLAAIRKLWQNPQYEFRQECLLRLPAETGFSREMIEIGLTALVEMLNPHSLKKKLTTELGSTPRWPESSWNHTTSTSLAWQPLGVILHVLAGNVFLGAVSSLLEGIITGNVNILKMSSGEKTFLPLLLRSFAEADPEGILTRSTAMVEFSSSQSDVINAFKQAVDGVVVWGGEAAVQGWREHLPARTRLIEFGPKLSFAMVSNAGMHRLGVEEIADALAQEMSIWDQNACTAPQICYVEGEANASLLVDHLGCALDAREKILPAGSVDLHAAVEIQKMRSVAEIAEGRGLGMLRKSKQKLGWTVVLDSDPTPDTSPLHRTLKVVPVKSLAVAIEELSSVRGYLQTCGLAAAETEEAELTHHLVNLGVPRIVDIGLMAGGLADDPHDGKYDLPQLLNLVVRRHLKSTRTPWETLNTNARDNRINANLQQLIRHARQAPHYANVLANLEINTTADLCRVPILSREILEREMKPYGCGLITKPWQGGYVTRSGGSTGEPKFSIYDHDDWNTLIDHAVHVLQLAGVSASDRIANCFFAGDLYGSFVSFDHINHRIGAATFAFAQALKPEILYPIWEKFSLNCIQGVPAFVVPVLKAIKDDHPDFHLEKFIFAGQPLAAQDRLWLRTELGIKRIASVIGANDGGQIAAQCEHMEGAEHHIFDDYNYIEIVDDKGILVPDGEPGRILITSLRKLAFPLIRYDIGDRARIIPQPCLCGRALRRIEYLGRNDDGFSVGMINFKPSDLEPILADQPISAIQFAALHNGQAEEIEIRIESSQLGAKDEPALRQLVLERFPLLQKRMDDKILGGLRIRCFPTGYLPRNPRTGKLKGMVDER